LKHAIAYLLDEIACDVKAEGVPPMLARVIQQREGSHLFVIDQ
jgi:hypothetical protein